MQHYLVKSWFRQLFGYCIFLRSTKSNAEPPKVSSLMDRLSINSQSTISKTVYQNLYFANFPPNYEKNLLQHEICSWKSLWKVPSFDLSESVGTMFKIAVILPIKQTFFKQFQFTKDIPWPSWKVEIWGVYLEGFENYWYMWECSVTASVSAEEGSRM